MKLIGQSYRIINLLSLDVVLGSCLMSAMIASSFDVVLAPIYYLSLATAVWLIYTLDHLIDAKSVNVKATTDRHRFHWNYFKGIGAVWIIVLVTVGPYCLWNLPFAALQWGTGAVIAVVVHFALIKLFGDTLSWFVQKEVGVAFVYASGVVIGTFAESDQLSFQMWLCAASIFVLAWFNLVLFSWFDIENDKQQGQTSIIRTVGESRAQWLVLLVGGLAIIMDVLLFLNGMESRALIMLTLATLVHVCIGLFKSFFGQNDRFRKLGDLVFCFPGILHFF